jgi:hypothetical protein
MPPFALDTPPVLYYCHGMFDQALFQRYEDLVRKIDLFCADLLTGFGPRLQCRPGCALCCGRDIEVLPVEFYYLRSCPAVAHAAGQSGSGSREPGGCTFDKEHRDCCPLNAGSLGLGTLARADLIDLERLNTLLSAVNLLFCRQAGIDPGQKLPLSRLADRL